MRRTLHPPTRELRFNAKRVLRDLSIRATVNTVLCSILRTAVSSRVGYRYDLWPRPVLQKDALTLTNNSLVLDREDPAETTVETKV